MERTKANMCVSSSILSRQAIRQNVTVPQRLIRKEPVQSQYNTPTVTVKPNRDFH